MTLPNSKAEKQAWVLENIPDEGVDILHQDFVQAFIDKFKAPHRICMWGANKCPMLNRLLSYMYHCNLLSRGRINLGANWQPGFPTWVYVYTKKARTK